MDCRGGKSTRFLWQTPACDSAYLPLYPVQTEPLDDVMLSISLTKHFVNETKSNSGCAETADASLLTCQMCEKELVWNIWWDKMSYEGAKHLC
ncbi:hypothetical protein FKM82_018601 [Ascaphus truei]